MVHPAVDVFAKVDSFRGIQKSPNSGRQGIPIRGNKADRMRSIRFDKCEGNEAVDVSDQ